MLIVGGYGAPRQTGDGIIEVGALERELRGEDVDVELAPGPVGGVEAQGFGIDAAAYFAIMPRAAATSWQKSPQWMMNSAAVLARRAAPQRLFQPQKAQSSQRLCVPLCSLWLQN